MDYDEIWGILAHRNLDETIGRLHAYIDEEKGNKIRLSGIPEYDNRPLFINSIDRELWHQRWKDKYPEYPQVEFTRNSFQIEGLIKTEITPSCDILIKILEDYHKATEKYNQQISEPFVEERKKTLSKIISESS